MGNESSGREWRIVRKEIYQMDDEQSRTGKDPTRNMPESTSKHSQMAQTRPLVNGRAKMARVYPEASVKGILKGLKEQMRADGEYREVNSMEAGPSPHEDPTLEDYQDDFIPKFENKAGEDQIFFDDITGV